MPPPGFRVGHVPGAGAWRIGIASAIPNGLRIRIPHCAIAFAIDRLEADAYSRRVSVIICKPVRCVSAVPSRFTPLADA